MEKQKRRFLFSVYLQDPVAKPLARYLIKIKANPNIVTICGLLVSLLSAYQHFNGYYIQGAVAFYFALVLDSTDGRVARGLAKYSKFGALLDSIADKIRSIVVSAALIYSFNLGFFWSVSLYALYVFLPILRPFFARIFSFPDDPTVLFWDASVVRKFVKSKGLVGLYNGWERAFIALIIGPLTVFPVEVMVFSVIMEQLIYFIGVIIFINHMRKK